MSAIHINAIKNFLKRTFDEKIDMRGFRGNNAESKELLFLSRAVAAFSVMNLTGISAEEAADTIVDGGQDNGIDAVFYHEEEHSLYLVQSKWRQSGSGSFDTGETLKFEKGFRDLVAGNLNKFNKKMQFKADEINDALLDAKLRIWLVLCHTGNDPISKEVNQILADAMAAMNDTSELVFLKVIDQKYIYNSINQDARGESINVDVLLNDWGQTKEPYQSFYGQICASDLAEWWECFYTRLFTPNIRIYLGETDVNDGIIETLRESPEIFWYYNNGITALCSSVRKKPIGGSGRESGFFECKDIRIVNGAQTVGSIARAFKLYPTSVQQARVPIRIISLENCPEGFEKEVTRSNNTQNRIDRRDFVALDQEQERIRNELRLENIVYVYKSGETIKDRSSGFDLDEATLARACSLDDVVYSVRAKGKISELWDDIEKAPYKALFNKSIEGLYLWDLVQLKRVIDDRIAFHRKERKKESNVERYITHGNLFIVHIVFRKLLQGKKPDISDLNLIRRTTDNVLEKTVILAVDHFPGVYAGNLFKNLNKCKTLVEIVNQSLG
jgi:hypothetical protein